ncbi:MAG: response regulator [Deltaproteobacteria bacterium]|nr:response regulator [Deltaproteobacteria bacterium]
MKNSKKDPSKTLEVVCIDDEPDILEFYKYILEENHQWPVVTFSSSLQAKAYVEKNFDNIGAIICDNKMPDMDGLSLLKEISSRFGNIPFLLVSGNVEKQSLEEFGEKISGFFPKPIEIKSILEAVTNLVSKTKINNIEKLEMGRDFADEAIPKVFELEKRLLQLESSPKNIENIQAIYRILHTLKGTAASVGFAYLAIFNHDFEARLLPIRDGMEEMTPLIVTNFLSAQAHLLNFFLKLKQGELVELTPFEEFLKGTATANQTPLEGEAAYASKISVDVTILNSFLEGVGELTILRNLLLQKIEAMGNSHKESQQNMRFLISILSEMNKTQSSMQKNATELLKIPFDSLLPSLRRNVRDLSMKLDKKVSVDVIGESALFDHNALQALSDSMVHLLRNSVDHGIEHSAERVAKGKSQEGRIIIQIKEVDKKSIITISDDGKGIDPVRVGQKAIEKQLKTEAQIKGMSVQQINALIFEAGFSTAEAVTEVSGRGVGMDMVKKSIQAIGGSVLVSSEMGKGTTFEIQIPKNQSLRIIKTIIASSAGIGRFTIPFEEVLTMEKAKDVIRDQRILNRQGKAHVLYEGEFISTLQLSEISPTAIIILLQKEIQRFAVVVDNIESTEETVIRELDKWAMNIGFFNKAAISGSHGTLLFLDTNTINKMIGNLYERAG